MYLHDLISYFIIALVSLIIFDQSKQQKWLKPHFIEYFLAEVIRPC